MKSRLRLRLWFRCIFLPIQPFNASKSRFQVGHMHKTPDISANSRDYAKQSHEKCYIVLKSLETWLIGC